MSGVFGFVRASGKPSPGAVATIGERLSHSPHHRCEYETLTDHVALGRRHIGLLNPLPQPRTSPCGQITLVLAGELYHQERLRETLVATGACNRDADDAELALASFVRSGAAGLAALEGAFAIAVWDQRDETLWIVNDRFGLYPHYYAHIGRTFVFAPEIAGILGLPEIPRRLNETAICEFLRFQQLLGEKTWLEDVSLLPPASVLRYTRRDNQLTIASYWDWDQIADLGPVGFAEGVAEASRLFQRAIDTMTAPPLRPGVFLSGGLDGRIILAFAADRVPITALTFGDPACRDMVYATELARRAHVPHHLVPLHGGAWVQEHAEQHLALTEGMHSFIHMHGISALPKARELMDVNLSGWDGGLTMGAFAVMEHHAKDRFYRFAPDEHSLTQRLFAAFCAEMTWPGITEAEAASLLTGKRRERLRDRAFESLREVVAATNHYPAHRRVEYFVARQQVRRSLQNQIITQRSTVEVRCPYFDYDFVSLMYGLPDDVRATPQFRRALLTRRAPALATVPYDKDDRLPHSNAIIRESHGLLKRGTGFINRRIPALFAQRTKLYADYEQYLRTDLRRWAEGILFDPRTLERGLFEPNAVRLLWEQHVAGDQLWTIGKVAPLISLELTLRHLYDDVGQALELRQAAVS